MHQLAIRAARHKFGYRNRETKWLLVYLLRGYIKWSCMGKDKATKVRSNVEELPGILTKDIFVELAGYNKAPCVSILMPTHKAGVEVNERVDVSAFKTCLQQVEKRLIEKGTDQTTIKRMLTPAYDLLKEDAFWHSLNNGLAVYMADGFFKFVKLWSSF